MTLRLVVLIVGLTAWQRAAHADAGGPVVLVVNSDDPSYSWERVQRSMEVALGVPIVAADAPAAAQRRALLTVSWRPTRHELAVSYQDARGTIGRIVAAPDDVAAAVDATTFLAVNLARDQVAELLGPRPEPAVEASPPAPADPAPRSPIVTTAQPTVFTAAPPAPRWTVALLGGVGAGWASGSAEVNTDLVARAGMAPAGVAHVAPEVGFFLVPRLLLSISMRLQFLTGTNELRLPPGSAPHDDCGQDGICAGARNALAGFARATFFGADMTRSFRPYVSLAIGGGRLRYPVSFPSRMLCGPQGNSTCVDTITTGPFFAGPGVGLRYRVVGAVDVVAGLEVLLGGPRFAFNADLNAGAAVSF
jgi:hypothetical protein